MLNKKTQPHKILILGTGQVGATLVNLKWPSHIVVSSLTHQELDVTNQDQLEEKVFSKKWDFIINATGFVKVDEAERKGRGPYLVNGLALLHLSLLCQKYETPLFHYTTDYVFDGKKQEPYLESDIPNPLNTYGLSKLFGETAIQAYLEKYIILRTSWVYGIYGHNFVKTILKKAKEGVKIYVVNDQWGTPTYSKDLGNATKEIILYHLQNPNTPKWDLYHYAGEGETSWYEYAKFILEEYMGIEKVAQLLIPISTKEQQKENPLITIRPSFSALDSHLIKKTFDVKIKNWKEGVREAIHFLKTK